MSSDPSVLSAAPANSSRKPRLLWANLYCLLDTSSGASMAVREMLLQLHNSGYEIAILGATVFDAEHGRSRLLEHWPSVEKLRNSRSLLALQDGPLIHRLVVTSSIHRSQMDSDESKTWYRVYQKQLDSFKPDLVFYYGGTPLDMLIAREASVRGIPVAFYLCNGNYSGSDWCRDVDLLLTDSQATADFYRTTQRYPVTPIGAFIDPATVVAPDHSRERILFVNPTLEKGVGVLILLALMLEQSRPDIVFEVVESRGNWRETLQTITAALGAERSTLTNVVLTPNTADMRPVYGRARLLLAPSLCWESSGRVLVEAMLNAIPVVVSDRGGMPEMIRDAGVRLQLPAACYERPYNKLPQAKDLEELAARLQRFFDDEAHYQEYVSRARAIGSTLHSLEASTARLVKALAPLLAQRAGDRDHAALQRQAHKLGLAPG
jgi:glycosyltransferase involved in cell wall biosynthesis